MRKNICLLVLILILTSLALGQATHPRELTYPSLRYDPPRAADFRQEMPQGLRAWVAEDHSLPLVTLTAIVNYGFIQDGAEHRGCAELLEQTLIKGGTKTREGSTIEQRVDFLGGRLTFDVGERWSTLNLTVLSKDLDEGLDLFFDVLRNPAFRDESLHIARGRLIEGLRNRNDSPKPLLEREFERLLYGEHPLTPRTFKKDLDAVSSQMLSQVHGRYFFPANTVFLAAGDFAKAGLTAKVSEKLKDWANQPAVPALPEAKLPTVEPGVYVVEKPINQGYVNIGHLGIEENNPDYFDVMVMNFILGGGSFTSRITSRVRSDEGLAYNTGSRFTFHTGYPGTFCGYVQTKSSTVGYAIELIRKEFERIRTQPVSDAELETARNFYVESFSEMFSTPMSTLRTLALLELQGRPLDYYQSYREKFQKVTAASVQAAAQKYLHPDALAIMVVGNWKACNVTSPKFSQKPESFGPVHMIPLVDYLTGQPIN